MNFKDYIYEFNGIQINFQKTHALDMEWEGLNVRYNYPPPPNCKVRHYFQI